MHGIPPDSRAKSMPDQRENHNMLNNQQLQELRYRLAEHILLNLVHDRMDSIFLML